MTNINKYEEQEKILIRFYFIWEDSNNIEHSFSYIFKFEKNDITKRKDYNADYYENAIKEVFNI